MKRIEGVCCNQCLADILIPENGEKSSALGLITEKGVVWFCSITCATTHPLWKQREEEERYAELEAQLERRVNGARQTCFEEQYDLFDQEADVAPKKK